MKTANQVNDYCKQLISQGLSLMLVAWKVALACVGWAYVFGARGQYCDPVNRRSYYKNHGADHPTIKSACRNFEGSDKVVGACAGCKYYPDGRTRFFDCRGFVYWVLKLVYGWELMGAGATSQWSNGSNWKAKGEIATMPKDVLCCLFVKKGQKMEHVGFGFNNETVECSSGVQHFNSRNKKWTHWAVPACIRESVVPGEDPAEEPEDERQILKKGSKGDAVKKLQEKLMQKGYDLGKWGADGDFGSQTEKAVKEFQRDHDLKADGIVGKDTWDALEQQGTNLYTVTIPHVTKYKAEALVKDYADASMKEEGV